MSTPEVGARPTRDRAAAEHVLLVVDGGLAGIAATRWIAARAATRALDVHLVDVLPPERPGDGDGPGSMRAEAGEAAEQARDLVVQLAPAAAVHAEVVRGDADAAVRDRIGTADLVVVGSNRTPLDVPRLTTSFAGRIAAWSSRPVVVVPRGWEPSSGPVLLAAEGDGSDDRAAAFAAEEAEAAGRQLVVLHAWRLLGLGSVAAAAERSGQEAAARLDEVVRQLQRTHPALQVAPLLEREGPAKALTRLGWGSSLVVLGRHAVTRLDRLLQRSVSAQAVERPTCPIAVVPNAD